MTQNTAKIQTAVCCPQCKEAFTMIISVGADIVTPEPVVKTAPAKKTYKKKVVK